MIQEIKFDKELRHFLDMVIEIWPTLKSGLKHIDQIVSPSPHSFLPNRQYKLLSPEQFKQTITNDLFQFIMTHDVKLEHIQDYMNDILQLLMIEEQLLGGSKNPASVSYMSNYIFLAIQQLLQGKNKRIKQFEQNIYNLVKECQGQIISDPNNPVSSSQDEEQQQDDYEDIEQQDEYSEEEEENHKQQQKIEANKYSDDKQLQDDGWNIVKKKRR